MDKLIMFRSISQPLLLDCNKKIDTEKDIKTSLSKKIKSITNSYEIVKKTNMIVCGKSLTKKPQTVEFNEKPQHDTYFNNIEKAKAESLYAVKLIRNPGSHTKIANTLSEKLYNIISNLEKNDTSIGIIKFLESNTGSEGQYGRISGGIKEIYEVLKNMKSTPENFVKKMLLIKSFGAYLIDHASKKPEEHASLLNNTSHKTISSTISQYKPEALFSVRGRSEIKSKEYRADSGILDKETFNSLSQKEKENIIIPGLSKERPLFRTFINEQKNGKKNISPFVDKTFDADNPLIASISGSTSCIMVASTLLMPNMSQNEKLSLAKSAVAFLVGGGYHSATEVLNVAYPGLSFNELVNQGS